jgi:hypothetical protein
MAQEIVNNNIDESAAENKQVNCFRIFARLREVGFSK